MKNLAWSVLLLAACAPDFSGDASQLSFNSSLSRSYRRWTPSSPIAVGTSVTFWMVPPVCLFDCPPPLVEDAVLVSDGGPFLLVQRAPDAGAWITVRAQREGRGRVHWYGTLTDSFGIFAHPAAGLALSDPLLFDRPDWSNLIGFDGGTWPDVGTELAMGAGGKLYLEVLVLDDAGVSMGFESAQVAAQLDEPDAGWGVHRAGTQLDFHAPLAGRSVVTLSFLDGGATQPIALRVADPAEAAGLSFLVQDVLPLTVLVKAVVTTADGGSFFEPPLAWSADPRFVELDLATDEGLKRLGLRPRRDVRLYRFDSTQDAGSYLPEVSASIGPLAESVKVAITVPEPPPPEPAPPPPPPRSGCAAAPGAFCLLALAATLRSRRRAR